MLKNYDVIITDDQSLTLFSKKFQENCHNLSGAMAETKYIYLEGCDLQNRVKNQNNVSIIEVGFGTGMGYEATYNFFNTNNCIEKLTYYSFEQDVDLINWSFDRLKEKQIDTRYLNIIGGDARSAIQSLIDLQLSFDCIYQDAFSPKKNPTLWSVEWFKSLKKISHDNTILATYSASSRARKSLIEAGWIPKIRPGFQSKSHATTATLHGSISLELKEKLSRSNVSAIYDQDLNI